MKTLLMPVAAMLALAGSPAGAQQDAATSTNEQELGREFSLAELDQMLAPIALYPDALLSQVLMASTYPLEIVAAARWSRSNPDLESEQAVEAVADVDWDPSVKGLVAFPDLLRKMDEDLDWTRRLGDAFLYQEDELMDRVQFLRNRAYQAGHLESTEYARVVRDERDIAIEPVRQQVVHVPYYDPALAYGSWWHPAYPPPYWLPPPFYHVSHSGFFWSHGVVLSSGFFYSSPYWPRRHIVILHAPRYCRTYQRRPYRDYYSAGQHWNHDPWHRRGVDYRHARLRERFARASASGALPMTATRDAARLRSPADGGRATAVAGSARPRLARGTEATAGGRATGITQARPTPRPPARSGSDSATPERAATLRARRQRDAAADSRGQDETNRGEYRGPAATLARPR